MEIAFLLSRFDWVVGTLLDTSVEVHATQLGVVAGIVVGILRKNGFERTGLGLLAGLLVLSICVVTVDGGPVSVTLHRAVQLKPWYFGTALVTVYLLVVAGLHVRSTTTDEPDEGVAPFGD